MPRYIDADQIEKYVTREDHGTPDERWRPEREFCAIIDSIPTADVQEVKHGHWIEINSEMGIYRCSQCRETAVGQTGSHFCPNCGAKMDEEESKC